MRRKVTRPNMMVTHPGTMKERPQSRSTKAPAREAIQDHLMGQMEFRAKIPNQQFPDS